MKTKGMYLIGILWLVGNLAVGCTHKEEGVEQEMIDYEEVFTLNEFINKWGQLPQTNAKYNTEDIVKIMHITWTHMYQKDMLGVDLGGKELYIDPKLENYSWKRELPDYEMTEEDVLAVRSIIDQYDVLSWKGYYGKRPASGWHILDGGAGWTLVIQFSDGRVRLIEGNENEEDFPDGKKDFVREMVEFAGSKEANIVREDEKREWITGITSYVLTLVSNEEIKLTLKNDIKHDYNLSVSEPEFVISKEGEMYTRGFLRLCETSIDMIENIESYAMATMIERSMEEYPRYVFYQWRHDLGSKEEISWCYEIKFDENSSGVTLINTISEESAREIYELLSFEVVTE